MDGERLQKVLAAAGVGSRRVCDQLIADGRVTVDGKVAVLGTRVDPQTAVIHVDGTRIPTRAGHVVLALHKPRGVASAMTDQKGLPCVGDYVADRPERVFHVGRLDVDTEHEAGRIGERDQLASGGRRWAGGDEPGGSEGEHGHGVYGRSCMGLHLRGNEQDARSSLHGISDGWKCSKMRFEFRVQAVIWLS